MPRVEVDRARTVSSCLLADISRTANTTMINRLKQIREMHDDGDEIEEVTDRHFYWRILGGKWTAKHKSVAADCANQFARQHARQWCSLFSWPVQKGFAFNMYGQFESVQLAKAWTRKANFLFARCGWMMGGPATTSTRRSS